MSFLQKNCYFCVFWFYYICTGIYFVFHVFNKFYQHEHVLVNILLIFPCSTWHSYVTQCKLPIFIWSPKVVLVNLTIHITLLCHWKFTACSHMVYPCLQRKPKIFHMLLPCHAVWITFFIWSACLYSILCFIWYSLKSVLNQLNDNVPYCPNARSTYNKYQMESHHHPCLSSCISGIK